MSGFGVIETENVPIKALREGLTIVGWEGYDWNLLPIGPNAPGPHLDPGAFPQPVREDPRGRVDAPKPGSGSRSGDPVRALPDPAVHYEALTVLRGLIESVVMHARDGGFTVELVGEIANMVALALRPQTNKAASSEAAVPDAYRCSVKVVAGAGFVQERTNTKLIRSV